MRVDEGAESIGLDVSQHGEKLGVHVDDEEFLAKVRIKLTNLGCTLGSTQTECWQFSTQIMCSTVCSLVRVVFIQR